MQHLEAPQRMRRIEGKKLSLNKETLRSLTGAELANVAGATTVDCMTPPVNSGRLAGCQINDPNGPQSRAPALPVGCSGSLPDFSPRINPSPIVIIDERGFGK
jgi:hypothetical protein